MSSGEGTAPTLSIVAKGTDKLTPSTGDEYAEPQSRISLIQALSRSITNEVQTLSLPSVDGVYDPDDEAALAWIQQSLEDVEATLRAITPP